MLLSPGGIDRINLGKGLDERFERQQTPGHAQVVSIGNKGRTHDQTDDGLAQGRATEAKIRRHLSSEVYASTAGISISKMASLKTETAETAIRPSMPRSDGSSIARNDNCIYIPDVPFVRSSAGAGGGDTPSGPVFPRISLGAVGWPIIGACSPFPVASSAFPQMEDGGATFIVRFFAVFPRI